MPDIAAPLADTNNPFVVCSALHKPSITHFLYTHGRVYSKTVVCSTCGIYVLREWVYQKEEMFVPGDFRWRQLLCTKITTSQNSEIKERATSGLD
jgi:hypothetical protein